MKLRSIRRVLLAGVLLGIPGVAAAAAPGGGAIDGVLSIVWGDGQDPAPRTQLRVSLNDDAGRVHDLVVSHELLRSGVMEWSGRRVRVHADPDDASRGRGKQLRVHAIQLLESGRRSKAAAGSQPWISLLCRYADIAAEPKPLAYFQDMYANTPGGLDHFWREVSYDALDIAGSIAIDWISLPGTQTDYVPTPGSGADARLNAIFDDCTAAVDAIVDFSGAGTPFAGINLMLNDAIDCCAWGGSRFATLDGVTKSWPTTWNPPFSYAHAAIIAHEMGHGFGMPHANNFDDDGNPYDSPWDLMSAATGYAVEHPTYGALGKHVNAYHKDKLGWFAGGRGLEVAAGSVVSIELDHTALAAASGYQAVVLPIDAGHWYTIEARKRSGDYEAMLVGDAVIIHEVKTGRSEPSWAVDADQPPANYSDNPGTMWVPGEIFVDDAHDVRITIDYATADGFGITIDRTKPVLLFVDGFEE